MAVAIADHQRREGRKSKDARNRDADESVDERSSVDRDHLEIRQAREQRVVDRRALTQRADDVERLQYTGLVGQR